MLIRFSNPVLRPSSICGWALLLAAGVALAADKIRFSEQPENTTSPNQQPKGDLSHPFERKQGSPGGIDVGPLPPPPNANNVRDPKLEEWIDQKKNWMFVTPADSDRAVEEMFNVREYKFDELGGGKKPKSQIDRYFEHAAEARRKMSSKLDNRTKGSDEGEDEAVEGGSIVGLPLESGAFSPIQPTSDLDPSAWGRRGPELGNPASASPGDPSPRNFNSIEVLGLRRRGFGGGSSQFFGQEQREQRLEEFQKTLGIVNPVRPALLRDPINLQIDGTRQPINPILGTGSPGIGTGLDTGLRGVGSAGLGGPSPISDIISSRPVSGSSLSPAVRIPSAPVVFQPRPAVLEIPRRKF